MFPLCCALLGGANLGRHVQNWQGEGSTSFKAGCRLPSNTVKTFLHELHVTGLHGSGGYCGRTARQARKQHLALWAVRTDQVRGVAAV